MMPNDSVVIFFLKKITNNVSAMIWVISAKALSIAAGDFSKTGVDEE